LIGNSIGGHLAIEIANEIPNLKGLVIMGSPPLKKPINFEEAFIPVTALNTFLTENPNESEINSALDIAITNKLKKLTMISDFKKANPLVRKAIAIDLMENKLSNQYGIFTELSLPKFIISGDSDISVNRVYLEMIEKNCKTSCKIINFKNCGHYPSIDKPKKFIATIKKIAEKIFI
jgi:pimeloyl-ACP methyl ester carboxylesterase